MSLEQLTTITAVKQFLAGTQAVAFGVLTTKKERYSWIQKTLVKHQYMILGKTDKGSMTRYLMKVTGYSLAQIKHLIRQYVSTGTVKVKRARQNGFKRTYSEADIRLLVSMDERHGQSSGAVLKKLCERAFERFGQVEYQQLANISVAHLYNLRASTTYQRQRCTLTKTRPVKWLLVSGANLVLMISQVTYASIQYTRAIKISAKGSTMSTRWMRSSSFRLSSHWRALARRSCYRLCSRCWPAFPLK